MTRFKELRRIEKAMEDKDVTELQWAVRYCQMRLAIATMKQHEKHWSKMLRKVQSIMEAHNEVQT